MQTSAITTSLKRLSAEAAQLVREYELIGVEIAEKFDQALERAWLLGGVLLQIKQIVGHSNWLTWLAANLPQVTERHAQRQMELFRSNPGADSIADLSEESVRKFRFTFVPPKDRPALEGDVTFDRPAHHLTIVNDWRKLIRRVEIGQAQLDTEEAKRDLKPLWEWLCELYGAAPAI